MVKKITFFSRLRWLVKFFSFLSLRGRHGIVSLLMLGKETLINSVLRANRCVAAVLKPLRTTKYARALRSSRLALHPAKQIPQRLRKFLAAILDVLVFLLFVFLLITLARFSVASGTAFYLFGSVLCGFIIGASVTESLRSRFLFPLSLMFFGFLAACLTTLGWKEFVRDTPEKIQEGVFWLLLIVAILLLFWRLRASRQKR
jgi:hypothetical protein